jgi:hypothetical protein
LTEEWVWGAWEVWEAHKYEARQERMVAVYISDAQVPISEKTDTALHRWRFVLASTRITSCRHIARE